MPRRIYEDYAYGDAARAECIWPLPQGHWPALEGDARAEVAIIGGGYTGLSAALHLAQAGAHVTLLEAHNPGWGASGRNGGFCCIGGDKLGIGPIRKLFGADAAHGYVTAQRAAIDLVRDLLTTHNIDADTHSDGELQLAHHPRVMSALQAEQDEWANYGVKTRLIERSDLAAKGVTGAFHGGLHVPLGFALNPGKYAAGLAEAACKAGVTVHAHSPVTNITRSEGTYLLETPTGRLTADKLILATNGYGTDGLPDWMTGRYLPLQSNILVTRPLTDEEIKAQGWTTDLMAYDSRHLLHYFRLLPDRRFLFGSRGNIRATQKTHATMRARLTREFGALFPAWAKVETPYFWSGLVSLSRDLLPYVGPIGDWENAWAGMNYHGNGVAMGTWVGAKLADMALGTCQQEPVHTRPLPRFPFPAIRRAYLYPALARYRLQDGPPPR
ncbi:FAD-dependent oxidoreductase [Aliiroseovarius sediminis]|uniref:NAD(P)/FAD-dependent oxidoreductase n=1 Tax=Aliiroseovarius sediminis TaxID=2925839 RepID=UPI001F577568|nr:FAD-dependent oxidoreductase [uncultured Aliiroseovarius sp.]MCI2395181.1 FAD-dependent oxidoreductase [Aliiroseovarius sediminis]